MISRAAVKSMLCIGACVAMLCVASARAAVTPIERNLVSNQVLDTEVYVPNTETATWEIALPNGNYWVSITSGDARYQMGPNKIVIEDYSATPVINEETTSNQYVTLMNQPVTVGDGYLTITIGGGATTSTRPYTVLNSVVITNQEPVTTFTPVKISFQPEAPEPNAPWGIDMGFVYGVQTVNGIDYNYGWTEDHTANTRYRGDFGNIPKDSMLFVPTATTYEWNLEVPNGTYYVSLAAGDRGYAWDAQRVLCEDVTLIADQATADGTYAEVNGAIVSVFDGNITLKVGGGPSTTTLNLIEVSTVKPETVFPVRVNMQPGWAQNVPNWTVDSGYLYGAARGSGWALANDSVKRGINANQLYDTLLFSPAGQTRSWRFDLANGTYYFSAAVGDPKYTFLNQRLMVEGNYLIYNQPTGINEFIEVANEPVTVADGKLDVVLGGGSPGTLNWLVIDNTPRIDLAVPLNINFQPELAVPYGTWKKDNGSIFDPLKQYGWVTQTQARERNINADQRLDTLVYTLQNQSSTWEAELPNGNYLVSLAVGDPKYAWTKNRVAVEGTTVVNDVSTGINSFYYVTNHPVTLTDGMLTIVLGGSSTISTLNYVQITAAP